MKKLISIALLLVLHKMLFSQFDSIKLNLDYESRVISIIETGGYEDVYYFIHSEKEGKWERHFKLPFENDSVEVLIQIEGHSNTIRNDEGHLSYHYARFEFYPYDILRDTVFVIKLN